MEQKRFKTTVLPLRGKLLNYARSLTDTPEDAEDAVQEALLRLWARRNDLDTCHSVEAYAMTLTHNICVDLWRKRREQVSTTLAYNCTDESDSPLHLLEIKDETQLMRHIIDMLPPLQRAVMQLKDIDGYETEEIAAITGCNAEAIRANLSRARKKVRDTYFKIMQERKHHKEDLK